MQRMVLVRHGQTTQNRLGLIQGTTDTDLNSKGEKQAERLALELRDFEFDRIYSSPLIRARRTAEIIAGERDLPITQDPRLAEIDQGDWTLKVAAQLFDNSDRYREWATDPTRACPPNGETIFDVAERAKSFLDDAGGQCALVVAHAGVIAVLLSVLGSRPLEKAWELLPKNAQPVFFPE